MTDNDKTELIKSVRFANEFLKVTRGVKKEWDQPNPLPDEIIQHLANDQINEVVKKFDLEPEMLIWGMVHVIEILMRLSDTDPEELAEMIDKFIDWQENRGD